MKLKKTKLGIIGCGAIGSEVAHFVDSDLSEVISLYALLDLDTKKAQGVKKDLKNNAPLIADNLDSLVADSDIILEAASWQVVEPLIKQMVAHKKEAIILSIGALIKKPDLLKEAKRQRLNVYLPSGAICGVDGILASAQNNIVRITLTTTKPPKGFKNSSYLKEKNIDVNAFKTKTTIFEGTPQEAFQNFPKNINVAATILLASNFPNIKVRIVVDPETKRNLHRINITSRAGTIEIKVRNLPSTHNPKTSALTIASTKALLNKLYSSIKIGT